MATKTAANTVIPKRAEQILALKSRLRGRICDVVYSLGHATVHEIADWLDAPVSTLYEHLDALIEAGLLEEGDPVRTNKNFARTVLAPGTDLKITHTASNAKARQAIADVLSSQLRLAGREFERGLVRDKLPAGEPGATLDSGSAIGWLNEDDRREVRELLGRVMEIYARSSPDDGRELQAITWVTRPPAK